jgi:hypothetical protein
MKHSIKFFEKVIEGHTRTTIVALEVGVILHRINVTPCLTFIALGVPTDRAAEVVEIRFNPLKFLQA